MTSRKRVQSNNNGPVRQNLPRRCKEIQTHYAFDIDFEENDVNQFVVRRKVPESSNNDMQEAKFLTILSWLYQMKVVKGYESIEYRNKELLVLREGKLTPRGILCNCCNSIVPVFEFPHHLWYILFDDKPFENIFIKNTGISLLMCLMEAWNRHSVPAKDGYQHVVRRARVHDNHDDACLICADGGDLICCEKCPSTYHYKCMGFTEEPQHEWLCPYCCCKYCHLDVNSYMLLTCLQCSKKYHWACSEIVDKIQGFQPQSIPLCGQKCRMLYQTLEGMVGTQVVLLESLSGFTWTLVRRMDIDVTLGENATDLHRRVKCNAMVALSAKIMEDSFKTIVDRQTRANTIQSVVYNRGSNFTRTNFSRFYTVVLERNGFIVTVASLRIASPTIAEIPLIATNEAWRNKGLCQLLLLILEQKLHEIGVEHIVIPSAQEMVSNWQRRFGFKPLDESLTGEIRKLNTLMFPTTARLQKDIRIKLNHDLNLPPKEEQE